MLDIVAICYHIQFQGKLMIQTQRNDGKPHFEPDLGPLGSNAGCQIFFVNLVVKHCSKLSSYAIQRKTNEPNLRKWQKNLIFDPIFASLAQIWVPKIIFVGFTSTRF